MSLRTGLPRAVSDTLLGGVMVLWGPLVLEAESVFQLLLETTDPRGELRPRVLAIPGQGSKEAAVERCAAGRGVLPVPRRRPRGVGSLRDPHVTEGRGIPRSMPITTALSSVAVADLADAKEFYSNLFGRGPDLEPMPTLAQWDIPGGGGIQVVEQPESSGSSMVTLLVTDFDAFLDELGVKSIDHGEVITGVISRVTQTMDPAGNTVTFAEVPSDS